MSKVKVSPDQMKFWEDYYDGDKVDVLKRMTKEFNIGLTAASEIYNNFPSSFHVVDNSNNVKTFLPSHPSDNRVPVFLKKESLDYIDSEMRAILGDDPYKQFMRITPDIRTEVFDRVCEELEGIESSDQLSVVKVQYPFGVYPIYDSRLETVSQVKEILEQRMDSNNSASLPLIISDFLSSITYWDEEQQVTSYIAIAELLYAHASDKIQEMKERPDSDS